jgi:digeranylgeranylglycerophospholipid reductase
MRSGPSHQPVVIIGASTAGLFSAYLLARQGVAVRLFDQGDEPGPPARTLIVTSRISDVLGFVPTEAIVNRTPVVQLFSADRSATIRLREPDLIVERERLIQLLARKAREAGVDIRTGCRFLGLESDRDGVVLRVRNGRDGRTEHVSAQTVVGADGVFSQVARAVERDSHGTVALLQAIVRLPKGAGANTTQVWFDPQATPYFYWLIPEAAGRAAAGLIGEDGKSARESLDRFLAAQKLEPLSYQAAQVSPYGRQVQPWREISKARILLVGDAAGQVKVTTVGGVVTGLRGAWAAARAILRGSDYGRELDGLRRELDMHLLMRKVLNRFVPSDYDALLDLLNPRTTDLLSIHTRDEASQAFFRLLLAQPHLLSLAARAFVRQIW